ncbi:hypothetical protein Sipo8835_41715 [Streptomyces ipomoeae]|uniref:Tat pathway signal sequence domain protein n=2 Tax=Streptomyces ipomoeae TaxID=103232 RepID=L1L9U3_9ACTN|nr:hypothetical protein [Streptomyces ipomoeae]EKX69455.1 hypothetical protein STRIP9103_03217 [Streptomyces ipomoeae 91-03]MDX2699777.1 hypothetical protein [Streptomyces ipomoeae]MDX2826137.1 hypothetical protein [Streptomyces ipomoeae]MDX2845485.1 hypothetical protein [Streptomyces ipomoeae]MDX2879944.1 hypothetical protein [Streptomyces ipomoeae]
MQRPISKITTTALATAALLVTATGTASADGGQHFLALRAPAASDIQSVYVSGRGWTNWTDGGASGKLGEPHAPVNLDVCYSYTATNDGGWKQVGSGLRAHTNQAPGRQGVQRSNPRWADGTQLRVLPLRSWDCTAAAVGGTRTVTVPNDGLSSFWLSLS